MRRCAPQNGRQGGARAIESAVNDPTQWSARSETERVIVSALEGAREPHVVRFHFGWLGVERSCWTELPEGVGGLSEAVLSESQCCRRVSQLS